MKLSTLLSALEAMRACKDVGTGKSPVFEHQIVELENFIDAIGKEKTAVVQMPIIKEE